MSDVEKFISERKSKNPKAWAGFDEKYRKYAIGMLLAEYRVKSGMTLGEFARKSKMEKSALSRLENHGEDVRLSTIARYVETAGRPLELKFFPVGRRKAKTTCDARIELQEA